MADTLKLDIITPAAIVYSEDVEMVTMPAADGQIGVLPHHVPSPDARRPGRNHRQQERSTGCFSPSAKDSSKSPATYVSIVTDMAVAAKDIDEARAEEARQRAAARLRDKLADEEVASVNAALARFAGAAQRQAAPPRRC